MNTDGSAPAIRDGAAPDANRLRAFDDVFTQLGAVAPREPPPSRPSLPLVGISPRVVRGEHAPAPARRVSEFDESIERGRRRPIDRSPRRAAVLLLVGVVLAAWSIWQAVSSPADDVPAPVARSATAKASVDARPRTIAIEDVRLGDRLLGTNPIRSQAEAIAPDPATWRRVDLHLTAEDGTEVWVGLLRPEEWLAEHEVGEGEVVFVDLFEMGVEGDADVTRVGPCPEIMPGDGTIVTGTFKRRAAPGTKVVRLRLDGEDEATGVTANHPYWSADRRAFVEVGGLRVGEAVDTDYGLRRVVSVTPDGYADFLYNLETTEHVFRVGELGTLVHNSCTIARKFDGPIHHIATDKGRFAAQFKILFNRVGVDIQSPWNRMRLQGHVGPHGEFYHRLVLRRLTDAVGAEVGAPARSALIEELKALRREIRYGGLDALLRAVAPQVDVRGDF